MKYLDTDGLKTVWGQCKSKFATDLEIQSTEAAINVLVKNGDGATLTSRELISASNTGAGLLSAQDKAKLDKLSGTGTASNTDIDDMF